MRSSRGLDGLSVVIIGAGAGGLCMAIRLQDAGCTDITILEKSDGVGGTWRDNHYPGAACDVPSHLYSYSFARRSTWSRKFARQPEILDYFEEIADRYHLRHRIRFGVEVASAIFDADDNTWTLTDTDGGTHRADVVVSALGQLNQPAVPDIEGLDSFEGALMHSARWDDDHSFEGERVAVIGNGASAIQFVPHVAEQSEHLTIFQRSANWILPKPDRRFRRWERTVFARVPFAERCYRWWIYWRLEINFLLMRRSSRLGSFVQRKITEELDKIHLDGVPREALVPEYRPGCKRILISNDYYPTLGRPDVEVVLDHIASIEPDAVVDVSGTRHPTDTIVLGTGFRSTEFLTPMTVRGLGGRDLDDEWANGAEAHLGIAVAGFPNFFILYGPNTNLGHNSIIFMIEAQTRRVVALLERMLAAGAAAIDVSEHAMSEYNAALQRDAGETVWVTDCDSWYKDDAGRLTNNWPDFSVRYWSRMRRVDLDDYELIGARGG